MSIEKLITSLRAYPKHTAIRFSFDGKSESWLVETFHKLADTYEAKESEVAELRKALANLSQAVQEMIEDSRGIFEFAATHGCRYIGREVSLELRATQAVLDKYKEKR